MNQFKPFLMIEGQKWYYRLINKDDDLTDDVKKRKTKALFDDFPPSTLSERMVVQMTSADDIRLFSVFNSYIDFGRYQLKYKPEHVISCLFLQWSLLQMPVLLLFLLISLLIQPSAFS